MEIGALDPDWIEFDRRCAEEDKEATTIEFIIWKLHRDVAIEQWERKRQEEKALLG